MFKDEILESVVITSDSKEEKYVRDQLCQTKTVGYQDKGCQSVQYSDVEIQTQFEESLPQATRMKIDNSKNLINFMLSVYPMVTEQLLANVRSHAFDGYEVDWEDTEENNVTQCLHTLKCSDIIKDQTITSIDWNCTGSVIAAAYGSLDHSSWCVHQSSIHLWNIDRSALDENKADKIIDSDCCLMTISFHTTQPGILAGGDFSGKILIWDMSEEENNLVAYSGKDMISHQEPVTKLQWGQSKSSRSFELISVGADGKILFWDYNQLKRKLTMTKRFLLKSENIPRAFRQGVLRNDVEIGISCLSFSQQVQNAIYIGTEGGGILKCLTDSNTSKTTTKHSDGEKYFSPIIQGFEGHTSTVNAIDASPHHQNIFASCSSDTRVHIYSTLNVNPLHVIEPSAQYLLTVQWSPRNSTVFCITTSIGSLLVYNMKDKQSLPVDTVKVQKTNTPAHALSFNQSRPAIIASGDASNELKIWKLGDCFALENNGDDIFDIFESEDF